MGEIDREERKDIANAILLMAVHVATAIVDGRVDMKEASRLLADLDAIRKVITEAKAD